MNGDLSTPFSSIGASVPKIRGQQRMGRGGGGGGNEDRVEEERPVTFILVFVPLPGRIGKCGCHLLLASLLSNGNCDP